MTATIPPTTTVAARAVEQRLQAVGLRVLLATDGTLSKRIAEAHGQAVPFQIVIGAREAAAVGLVDHRHQLAGHRRGAEP